MTTPDADGPASAPTHRSAGPLVLAAALSVLVAACLGYLVMSGWAPLADLDASVGEGVRSWAIGAGWPLPLAWALNGIGLSLVTVPAVVLVLGLLLVTRHRRAAAWLAASAVLGLAVSRLVKAWVGRERPPWAEPSVTVDPAAFPSGHAMVGIYVWCVLGWLALRYVPGLPGRVLGWALIAAGIVMGPSRLLLGVHWPSDILAGWLLGVAALLVAAAIAQSLPPRRPHPQPPPAA